jgi:2-polyprenyl-3-methyl-5-hydroxy-6-metoxy-1,4-benzoquinol methylase
MTTRGLGMNGFRWNVGQLPFYYRPLLSPSNGYTLPNFMQFNLEVSEETGLLMQEKRLETIEALRIAYQEGVVIAGGTDESESGMEYAEDVLSFILSAIGCRVPSGLRVLDIGCGTGYLLYRLKQAGADVAGIEPGAYGQLAERQYKIPIIHDFFPSKRLSGFFDLVVMHMVLEHMQDPLEALREISNILTQSGLVIISVEDEQSYVDSGDPSILFHEHFSYFTEITLANCLKYTGFTTINLHKPRFSRILYVSARKELSSAPIQEQSIEHCLQLAEQYREKCIRTQSKLSCYFKEANENRESVGIYVPARAINILSMVESKPLAMRFFDDNPTLHGAYFPGYPMPIENRSQLIADPPKRLLVMSGSFGHRIIESVPEKTKKMMQLTTWEDIFLS